MLLTNESEVSSVDVLTLLKSRRSIRVYEEKPVPRDMLLKVLEAGRWAPTGANLQPWHFIVVTGKEKRNELGKVARFFFIKSSHVGKAPVVLVLGFDRRKGQFGRYDVTLAGANMVIMAESLGLGTCWIGVFDETRVKEILGVPEYIEIIALITLGFPGERATIPSKLDLEKVVHWESWTGVKKQTIADTAIRSGPLSVLKKFFRM